MRSHLPSALTCIGVKQTIHFLLSSCCLGEHHIGRRALYDGAKETADHEDDGMAALQFGNYDQGRSHLSIYVPLLTVSKPIVSFLARWNPYAFLIFYYCQLSAFPPCLSSALLLSFTRYTYLFNFGPLMQSFSDP
jgi:hypothetical protein